MNNEPLEVNAGDTWSWTRSFDDYPASTWTLTYRFVGNDDSQTVVAVADGDDFDVTVAASTSGDFKAGVYKWGAYVESGGERYTVDSGTLTVKPNFADLTPGAQRSHVEKVLEAIECVIEGRATKDQESYSINNRSLSRTPITDLLLLRDKYKAELRDLRIAEKTANDIGNPRKILFRNVGLG